MFIIKTNSTNGNHIIGIQCDHCGKKYIGDKWDSLTHWLYQLEIHFCSDCKVICKECHKPHSILSANFWYKNGICEKCQEGQS